MLRILVSALFLFVISSGYCQQYNFLNFSVEEGLAQSQVSDIEQDKGGYLWVATRGGLSRYDGKGFKNYSKNQGLISNQLSDLFIDENDRLWVGAEGGVAKMVQDRFQSYRFEEKYSKYQVNDMLYFRDTLYIATNGGGVVSFYQGKFYYPEKNAQINVRSMDIFNQSIIIGTREGVYQLKNKSIPTRLSYLDSLNDASISEIYVHDNTLFIGTYSGEGVFCYNRNKKQTAHYTSADGLISDRFRSIYKDENENLWFVSKVGVVKVNDDKVINFTKKNGLPHENINCVLQDQGGNMWFGTDGKGICLFTGEAFVNYTQKDGLASDFVMNIAQDTSGDLWFSTYGGGVTHWNSGNPKNYTIADGLPNNTVWSSLVDHEGHLWLGTSSGLVQFRNGKFVNQLPENKGGSNKVTYLFEDSQNRIWVGGQHGVWVKNQDSLKFYEVKDEMRGNNIRAIEEDENKTIWLGSQIGLYSFRKGDFRYYNITGEEETLTVYCLKWLNGALWIGTNNGLYVKRGDRFNKIRLSDNFNANTINFLLPQNNSKLWVGTNNGIYSIGNTSGEENPNVTHYTTDDGLKSLESNLNAGFVDQYGHLWFGTGGGLLKYSPEMGASLKTSAVPKVHIRDIRLYLEEMNYNQYADSINPATGLPADLSLPYNQNHVTFDFIGISLKSPTSIRYKFKLQGFDSEWSPATRSSIATYSNLPFGSYTFSIKATNQTGNWSEPTSFSFVIRPPFWRKWWFYLACFLTLTALMYMIIIIRQRRTERKRETQQLVYKSKLAALEQQSLNASMNRHFIFNALNSIQYFINTSDKLSANRYLTNFAKLIRKNLDSTTTENYIVTIQEEVDRIKLYLTLESMRFENKFDYEIDIDPGVDTETISIPSMMLQPFIENGIIHGILPKEEKGKITLKIYIKEQQLIFEIEDDGIGIENSLIDKKKKTNNHHDSKGMEITSDRIGLLQKITGKDISIEGPYQLNLNDKYPGSKVTICLSLDSYTENEGYNSI